MGHAECPYAVSEKVGCCAFRSASSAKLKPDLCFGLCVGIIHASKHDRYENLFQAPQGDAMILFMWQDDIIGVAHAWKECTHQLALLWGTRHLISPELAGKDVMILLESKQWAMSELWPYVRCRSGACGPWHPAQDGVAPCQREGWHPPQIQGAPHGETQPFLLLAAPADLIRFEFPCLLSKSWVPFLAL